MKSESRSAGTFFHHLVPFLFWISIGCLVLPPLLLPLYSPDLFMHLSVGRWIIDHAAWPRKDFLSFTLPGADWVDYEWLSQTIYYAVYSGTGIAGLWILKILTLASCGLTTLWTVRLFGPPPWAQAALLVLWSITSSEASDLRPDLFSLLLFSILLFVLESLRRGEKETRPRDLIAVFGIFFIWANLHPNFAFGLVLLACYIASGLLQRHRPLQTGQLLLSALAGTLCNPYGLGPYHELLNHWTRRPELANLVQEWQPLYLYDRRYWPFWPILAMASLLLCFYRNKKRLPLGLTAMTIFLAYMAMGHRRFAPLFHAAAIPLIAAMASDDGWFASMRVKKLVAVVGMVYAAWLPGNLSSSFSFDFFNGRLVPQKAAEFIAMEAGVINNLRVYCPWDWGGYLGFRLHPWFKVFADGRYNIFHSLVAELLPPDQTPKQFKDLVKRYHLEAAIVHNRPTTIGMEKVYRDGSRRVLQRPWYLLFFPRQRWALVYWDWKALVFVDRRRAPQKWLVAHEYRHVIPYDGEELADSLKRKEIPEKLVRAEEGRHRIEDESPNLRLDFR